MAIARTLPLPAPKPAEKILFAGESVAVCSFRCPPDDPLFPDSGPSNADTIVFPRNSVRVLREGGLDRVISVNEVSFYRQGESYRRRDIDGKGTICNWYVLAPAVLREMLGLLDPAARDDERPRFPAPIAPADARSFARQRRIVRHVEGSGPVDALWVEESVLAAVGRVLAAAAAPANLHEPLPVRQTELAEDAKLLLAATATENLALAELACRLEHIGVPPSASLPPPHRRLASSVPGSAPAPDVARPPARRRRGPRDDRGRPRLLAPQPLHDPLPPCFRRDAVRLPPPADDLEDTRLRNENDRRGRPRRSSGERLRCRDQLKVILAPRRKMRGLSTSWTWSPVSERSRLRLRVG